MGNIIAKGLLATVNLYMNNELISPEHYGDVTISSEYVDKVVNEAYARSEMNFPEDNKPEVA